MRSVSWFEPGLVVSKPLCFPGGSEQHWWSGVVTAPSVNDANHSHA